MMLFMTICIMVALVITALVIRPLFTKTNINRVKRDTINLESNAHSLIELKQRLDDEHISLEQYDQYRLEIEYSAATDLASNINNDSKIQNGNSGNYALGLTIVLFVPLLSAGIYHQIGDNNALVGNVSAELSQANAGFFENPEEMERILSAVEEDVLSKPDDIEGRIALGQVYVELERFADAAAIFRELYELKPKEPDFIVNYAEAMGRTHGNRLEGRPKELLDQALALEPNHGRALWLAGFAELQLSNPETALMRWNHLLKGLQADTEFYAKVDKLISDVETDGVAGIIKSSPRPGSNDKTRSDSSELSSQPNNAAPKKSIEVTVSVSSELTSSVVESAIMFVFARAANGPVMPLAVYKGTAAQLPLTVTLDESMAMMEQMSIADFDQITVAARLSSNGQPQGQAGDLEGISNIIDLSSTTSVSVVINATKP